MHNDDVADEGGEDTHHENVFHEEPIQQHVDNETIPGVYVAVAISVTNLDRLRSV